MGVLFVLLILVSGFLVCHHHPQYFFKLHRYEGQYLYLQAAYLGILCFISAAIFHFLLMNLLAIPVFDGSRTLGINYVELLARYLPEGLGLTAVDKKLYSLLGVIALTTLVMPFVIERSVYWRLKHYLQLDSDEEVDIVIMSELFSDSPLDQLLFSAMINDRNLMLVLDDRKVYVGRVATMGEPNENEGADQEISFLPFVSGYRDKDGLQVIFTTDYKKVGESLPLVIRQESIVSAREFDFSVYDSFQGAAKTATAA
jgi:hypothetical protein